MKALLRISVIVLVCTSLGCAHASGPGRILVLTERGGGHESFAAAGLEFIDAYAAERGMEVDVINDTEPVDREFLGKYRLFVQLDFVPYTWSDSSKAAFEEYIDGGLGGWVGFHHAALLGEFDGWPMWQWFSDLMGGIRFRDYIRGTASGTLHVEDASHPVMKGVSEMFVLPDDEWYTFDRSPRGNVRVLATVDEESYAPASDIRMGDHPVVWMNESKKANNVYFLAGHSGTLFGSEDFRRMFTNAMDWALETNRKN